MSSQILKGVFLFDNVYTLFGAKDDAEIISRMGTIGVCYTICVFVLGWVRPTPNGKFLTNLRFAMNAKISWMTQETPAFLVPLFLLLKSPSVQMANWPNQIAATLFMVHYFQRTFIYPFRVSRQATPVPLWMSSLAFLFCAWNGFYQGHHLINVSPISRESSLVWPGVCLFASGMLINVYHDGLLIRLRDSRPSASVGTGAKSESDYAVSATRKRYKIPTGGLFNLVSGANYLGEILEWWGLAAITRQFPQVLFAVFTTQYLGQRAWHSHKYYQRVYGSAYPLDRKAIIPFVL